MQDSTFKIISNKNIINIQCSVFESNNIKYGLISVADVTNVQKFEKQRVTGKFKTMYLQSIAHDLKTPLNTIISLNEHVMNYYKEDLMIQSTMKLSMSNCLYLNLIIDQVQEMSKYQFKLFKLENRLFNFRQKIIDFLENVIIQVELKQLEFKFEMDQEIPIWVETDFNKI